MEYFQQFISRKKLFGINKFLVIFYGLLEGREERANYRCCKYTLCWKFITRRSEERLCNYLQFSKVGVNEEKDKHTLSFVGRGNYSRHLQEWYVTQKPTIKTDFWKKSSPIISIFIAIKKIGHDFILSAIFQTLPFKGLKPPDFIL